ncbi:MAG: hypothetical protein U0610_18855 [bacterium]
MRPDGDEPEPDRATEDGSVLEVVDIRHIHHEHDDAIRRFLEWQEHQYDPGHFLGGRLHPAFTRSRPNPFGWWALGVAGLYVIGLASLGNVESIAQLVEALATTLLIALVGLELLARPGDGHATRSRSDRAT